MKYSSPSVSMTGRNGWIIRSRSAISRVKRASFSSAWARSKRHVSNAVADTFGLTTSASDWIASITSCSVAAEPIGTHTVGVTGTPAASRSRR